jgi:hypothetical protein
MKGAATNRVSWLTLAGQAILASACLLAWAAFLIVWFRVPGAVPPSSGCPLVGPCSQPFVEVLSLPGALALAIIAALMLVAAAIPRASITGFVAGVATVGCFQYFVYVVPQDRPGIIGPILSQATLLSWLSGFLALVGATVILAGRRFSPSRDLRSGEKAPVHS